MMPLSPCGTFSAVSYTHLRLDAVEHFGGNGEAMLLDAAVDDFAELFLIDAEADLVIERMLRIGTIHKAEILRDGLVEDDAADGRFDGLVLFHAVDGLGHADLDGAVERDGARLIRHERFLGGDVYKRQVLYDITTFSRKNRK